MVDEFDPQPRKRKKSTGDKRKARTAAPTEEVSYFLDDTAPVRYSQIKEKPIAPIKCWEVSFLDSAGMRYLAELFEKSSLIKFLTYTAPVYPRCVRMFYASCEYTEGIVSSYVMGKRIIIDVELLCELFGLDGSAPFHSNELHASFRREEALNLFFPEQAAKVVTGKTLTTGLSVEDRLLHYTLVKSVFPRQFNSTSIIEDDLFLMWAIKTVQPVNIPYLILKNMGTVFSKVPNFLPYGMILTTIFQRFDVPLADEFEFVKPNASHWINATTLIMMKMKLVEGEWVRADGAGGRPALQAGEGSSSTPASSEVMDLLRSLHLRQDEQFSALMKSLADSSSRTNSRLDSMQHEISSGYKELHSRMNDMQARLDEIKHFTTPDPEDD